MSELRTRAGRGPGSGRSPDPAGTHRNAQGSPVPASLDQAVTHMVRIDPSRSMKAVTEDVDGLLDGFDEGRRHRGALLASELVAQVLDPSLDWNCQGAELSVQLRAGSVRLEARGPGATPTAAPTGDHVVSDPIADWGPFLIERLADRWGLDGGSRRIIWAEVDAPA
jgi:hypothetical protein